MDPNLSQSGLSRGVPACYRLWQMPGPMDIHASTPTMAEPPNTETGGQGWVQHPCRALTP